MSNDGPTQPPTRLVEWEATARRMRGSALVLLGGAVLAWGVAGASGDGWSPGALGNWVGLALLGMFVVEVIVVGGSAVRGMLRAGDRGERLAGPDVGLFPPGRPRGDAESDDGA